MRATPSARQIWAMAWTLTRPVDRLAAGHGDGIVVEDLVGDVGPGRDRLADRHRAGMIPKSPRPDSGTRGSCR